MINYDTKLTARARNNNETIVTEAVDTYANRSRLSSPFARALESVMLSERRTQGNGLSDTSILRNARYPSFFWKSRSRRELDKTLRRANVR